jgi:2-polyprenyl-3-methyl-5-hydroxy-6-metoxy-1,4-benzoquinol methylase
MERESEPSVAPEAPRRSAPASANGRYDFEIDLGSDSTHAKVVRLVGNDKRVLELGPATGYMSRVLTQRGCAVVGIELDPDMAREAARHLDRVIVGDLETLDLEAELGESRFDVIVAADVLEHLRDPLAVLRRLRGFLAPDGFFVLSVPNVAHGSVRLALLTGRFPYQQRGLLDQTHLRFFTRETVGELLDEAELGIAELHDQQLNFDASEVAFDPAAVPAGVIESLAADPDARTYQFVIKAIPFAGEGMRELQRRMRELASEVARLQEENEQLRPLQEAFAAISSREGQLRASLIDAHEQLLQRDEQLNQLREELEPLHRRLERLKATPIGTAFAKGQRARQISKGLARRLRRYRAALSKL